MSDKGSFVTEYIYCEKCFEAAKSILIGQNKYLNSATVPHWNPNSEELPIIAGKIGGLYEGEEIHTFESEFISKLEKVICHNIRIAILAETGEMIITAMPTLATIESEAHRIQTRRFMGSFEKEITKKYLERKIAQEKTGRYTK